MQDKLREQYQQFIEQAKKNPQLMLLIQNLQQKWQIYGYRIKIALIIIITLIIITLGIRFGSSLARLFRPAPVTPEPIPDVVPTPTMEAVSQLRQIRDELNMFNVILPDPAPPAVDPEIHLESLPISRR